MSLGQLNEINAINKNSQLSDNNLQLLKKDVSTLLKHEETNTSTKFHFNNKEINNFSTIDSKSHRETSGFKRNTKMKNQSPSSNVSTDRLKNDYNSLNIPYLNSEKVILGLNNEDNELQHLKIANSFANLTVNKTSKQKTFLPQDSTEYQRFRMDELNNELIQKIYKNKLQSEHIANLEMKIDTYKKNISSLHDRIAKQDNMKIELNLQNKKINELEMDLNNGFKENK